MILGNSKPSSFVPVVLPQNFRNDMSLQPLYGAYDDPYADPSMLPPSEADFLVSPEMQYALHIGKRAALLGAGVFVAARAYKNTGDPVKTGAAVALSVFAICLFRKVLRSSRVVPVAPPEPQAW